MLKLPGLLPCFSASHKLWPLTEWQYSPVPASPCCSWLTSPPPAAVFHTVPSASPSAPGSLAEIPFPEEEASVSICSLAWSAVWPESSHRVTSTFPEEARADALQCLAKPRPDLHWAFLAFIARLPSPSRAGASRPWLAWLWTFNRQDSESALGSLLLRPKGASTQNLFPTGLPSWMRCPPLLSGSGLSSVSRP